MRRAWLFGVVVILAGAAIAAWAVSSGSSPDGQEKVSVTVSYPMGEKAVPISVLAAASFAITLPSNQTTGYQWRLGNKPDAAVVALIGSKYNAPKDGMIGQGGTETWKFKAVGAGKTTIMLEYARPWEKDAAPAKRQEFGVAVF